MSDEPRLHPLLAARWSPTTFDTAHEATEADVASLLEAARWAPSASVLVANLCHRFVEDTDWDYSEFALYDLGQAVAHMTIQAADLGLAARQFRAFDRAALAAEFGVPEHWEVTTMTAFGRAPDQQPSRERRAPADLQWAMDR